PYYRSVVGRRHLELQPLASVTGLNIYNIRHYMFKATKQDSIYKHNTNYITKNKIPYRIMSW
ncbi:MAG: hypothetical protein ACKPKO_14000, partial [Candidatus Fonsibacter sp.]